MVDPNAPPEYDYVAYIDESGDPGIRRVKPLDENGSSEWMMVAGVLIAADREQELGDWRAELMRQLNSRQMRDVHFNKLSAGRKLIACNYVAGLPVRCFVVASNKRNMRGHRNLLAEQIPSDNWFYCWMTRLLLERMTHYVKRRSIKDHGEVKRMKLVYSERGGLSYSQLNAYYAWLKAKGDNQFLKLGNIEHETVHMRLMEVHNHVNHAGLCLPDIVASAFFKAADFYDTGACDPAFANALAPRMAACPAGQHSGYGVKLMPGYGRLKTRLRPEQLTVFRNYGYPKQWWKDGGP